MLNRSSRTAQKVHKCWLTNHIYMWFKGLKEEESWWLNLSSNVVDIWRCKHINMSCCENCKIAHFEWNFLTSRLWAWAASARSSSNLRQPLQLSKLSCWKQPNWRVLHPGMIWGLWDSPDSLTVSGSVRLSSQVSPCLDQSQWKLSAFRAVFVERFFASMPRSGLAHQASQIAKLAGKPWKNTTNASILSNFKGKSKKAQANWDQSWLKGPLVLHKLVCYHAAGVLSQLGNGFVIHRANQ